MLKSSQMAYNNIGGDTMENRKCYDVSISWDNDAGVWFAISDSIPLALESNSFDALIEKVKIVAPEILSLNSDNYSPVNILIKSERLIVNG